MHSKTRPKIFITFNALRPIAKIKNPQAGQTQMRETNINNPSSSKYKRKKIFQDRDKETKDTTDGQNNRQSSIDDLQQKYKFKYEERKSILAQPLSKKTEIKSMMVGGSSKQSVINNEGQSNMKESGEGQMNKEVRVNYHMIVSKRDIGEKPLSNLLVRNKIFSQSNLDRNKQRSSLKQQQKGNIQQKDDGLLVNIVSLPPRRRIFSYDDTKIGGRTLLKKESIIHQMDQTSTLVQNPTL